MLTLTLALLAQAPLNLNQGYLRRVVCDGGVVCWQDGGVATIIGTSTGGGGGAPVDGGYVLWGGTVGSTNERVLTSSATASINTGTAGQVKVDVVTPVATASALAANPADCGANQYATAIAANGDLTCSQPAFSDLSGSATTGQLPTIPVTKGGTNLTTIAANQTWVGTAADTVAAKTLPSCSNGTTDKLLYDNATQTWSCGTDQTGGGGGTSPLILTFGGF